MKTVVLGLALAIIGAAQVPTCDLVPGWAQKGPARTYDASNLFEYMDGNAEGYLIYGFVRMNGVTCANGADSVLLDVSELEDVDLAYGIFSANRDPRLPAAFIGAGGQVTPRRAIFTKGRYYVEVAAPEKDQEPALRAFAIAVEQRISGTAEPPPALSWFPSDGLTSVRLIPESVLGMRVLKRGYMAQYTFGKAFVVREASEESAAAVMDKLKARFGQTGDPLQLTDKYLGRLCFFRKGPYVGGYANVADGRDPSALAAALAARLP